jgi:hypothetical protein
MESKVLPALQQDPRMREDDISGTLNFFVKPILQQDY